MKVLHETLPGIAPRYVVGLVNFRRWRMHYRNLSADRVGRDSDQRILIHLLRPDALRQTWKPDIRRPVVDHVQKNFRNIPRKPRSRRILFNEPQAGYDSVETRKNQ